MTLKDNDGNKAFETAVASGFLSETTVDSGESLHIEEGTSAVVVGPYTVDGELTVDGSLRVL